MLTRQNICSSHLQPPPQPHPGFPPVTVPTSPSGFSCPWSQVASLLAPGAVTAALSVSPSPPGTPVRVGQPFSLQTFTGCSQERRAACWVGTGSGRNVSHHRYPESFRAPSQNQRRKGPHQGWGLSEQVPPTRETWASLCLSRRLSSWANRGRELESLPWVGPQNSPATSARKLPCESWANWAPRSGGGGPAPARRKWTGFLFVCKSQSSVVWP